MRLRYTNQRATETEIQIPALQVQPVAYGQVYDVPDELAGKMLGNGHWEMVIDEEQPLPFALREVKGIGPRIEDALRAAGITTVEQLLSWTASDIDAVLDGALNYVTETTIVGWQTAARKLIEE